MANGNSSAIIMNGMLIIPIAVNMKYNINITIGTHVYVVVSTKKKITNDNYYIENVVLLLCIHCVNNPEKNIVTIIPKALVIMRRLLVYNFISHPPTIPITKRITETMMDTKYGSTDVPRSCTDNLIIFCIFF